MSLLVTAFFSLSFEIKKGELSEHDLVSDLPFRKGNNVYEKYFVQNPSLYNGKLWANLLFKGNLKSLNEHTSRLTLFIESKVKCKEKPNWVRLWEFRDLEDKEFEFLIEFIFQEVKDLKECDLRIYLHKISILLFFNKAGLFNVKLDDILSYVKSYVRKYKNSEHWKEVNINISSPHNGTGYQYLCTDDKCFIKISEIIKNAHDKILVINERNKKEQLKQNLIDDLLSCELDKVKHILFSSHRATPIFNEVDSIDFVNKLKNTKNEIIKNISYLIQERYLSNNTYNGMEYSDFLISEKVFWQEVKQNIDEIPSKSLKFFILRDFSQYTLSKVISRLSREN